MHAVPQFPRMIVGLGNPGKTYEATRHNVGFMIVDRLAERWGVGFKEDKRRKGMFAAGPGVLLVKPTTFMNESGMCVGPLAHFFKIAPEEILVVYDERAFPLGVFKIKGGGSSAGHNGIKSLIAHLGTQEFPRLRFGIGEPVQPGDMIGHVLGKFRPDERELLETSLVRAVEAILCIQSKGVGIAANLFNTDPEKERRKKSEKTLVCQQGNGHSAGTALSEKSDENVT